jgi:hypothetical protein
LRISFARNPARNSFRASGNAQGYLQRAPVNAIVAPFFIIFAERDYCPGQMEKSKIEKPEFDATLQPR